MRTIYRTPPTRAQRTIRGQPFAGVAHFEAHVFAPDEEVPPGHQAIPISTWLASMPPGVALEVAPPPDMVGAATAVIPRKLLEAQPEDSLLEVSWEIVR